jgi:Protein of unknown function (DUF2393)
VPLDAQSRRSRVRPDGQSQCKIALMGNPQNSGFLDPKGNSAKEPRTMAPWIVAGAVVLIVIGVLLLFSRHEAPSNPGGAGLAPPDPYATSLALSDIKMSESSSMAGAKVTYLDGTIANHGNKTLTGITVQVAFRDFTNILTQKETMPLSLIRTHQPYVDTQSVSAAPIKPGETREFRLIFDHVSESWNQQYPEIRVIAVKD